MSFGPREAAHIAFCDKVIAVVESQHYEVMKFGVENILSKEQHKRLMWLRDDDVSKFIRFVPDYILLGKERFWFFEIKSPSEKHANIAIELDAKRMYWQLMIIKLPVFIVMRDMLTCWATDIKFKRVFNNATDYMGSGTPFGLVHEELSRLIPLKDFLEGLV